MNDVLENYYRFVGEGNRERVHNRGQVNKIPHRIVAPFGADEPFHYSIVAPFGADEPFHYRIVAPFGADEPFHYSIEMHYGSSDHSGRYYEFCFPAW